MQLETYNNQKISNRKRNITKNINLIIFLAFLFIAGTILTQTMSPTQRSFTGFSIFPTDSNITSNAPIKASLSIPILTLKNELPEIKITIDKESSIILDGKTFSLKGTEREIIFKDFKGTISFDENKIYTLEGKASEVVLSGIPMTTDKTIHILLEAETPYKKIELTKDIYIKSLNYITTGEILIDQDLLKANFEEIFLNNYIGTIKAENKILSLDGKIESIELIGELRKIKISQ